jgi:hypothetical protein
MLENIVWGIFLRSASSAGFGKDRDHSNPMILIE